jgi:hypothetical protein
MSSNDIAFVLFTYVWYVKKYVHSKFCYDMFFGWTRGHFLCLFCFLLNFLCLLSSLGGSCRFSLVPCTYVGPFSLLSCVMSRSTVVCLALLSCVYPINVLSSMTILSPLAQRLTSTRFLVSHETMSSMRIWQLGTDVCFMKGR